MTGKAEARRGSNRHTHPSRSAGVVGTARGHGSLGNVGDPSGRGVATRDVAAGDGPVGVGEAHSTEEAG